MYPIQDVDLATLAFPAEVQCLMPPYAEIPEEFRRGNTEWNRLFSKWFFSGLKGKFIPKPDVDLNKAMRHLKAVMGSFQPKHEHKEAAAAFLMSEWFERFEPTEGRDDQR